MADYDQHRQQILAAINRDEVEDEPLPRLPGAKADALIPPQITDQGQSGSNAWGYTFELPDPDNEDGFWVV